jgi:hypothetical protein
MNDLILTIRQQSSLRIYVWLILLNAPLLETDSYLSLIHRGASPAYSKIRNDTFRTLATDPLFRRRVSEASLIRLLNAVAWKLSDLKEERRETAATAGNKVTHAANAEGSPELTLMASNMNSRARALTLTTEGSDAGTSEPGIYVQGMNVLAAPFLYAARSEAEAFVAFYRFITTECPGYVRGAMDGVHKGLALVDKVLSIVDPKLSFYLILCISLGRDTLCLHAAIARSLKTLGLSLCLWCTFEYSLYRGATGDSSKFYSVFPEVRHHYFSIKTSYGTTNFISKSHKDPPIFPSTSGGNDQRGHIDVDQEGPG